jgi:hypothetical protein
MKNAACNKALPGYTLWMTFPEYVRFVRARAEMFNPGFAEWLQENPHIWERFKAEADRVRRRRDHYSARTIVHFLRHETALSEAGGEFKINNNASPDMARLYMATTPGAEAFFETRGN